MATKLSIFNSTLAEIGAEPISSLNENNKRAKLLNNIYDTLKKKELRAHPWNFAIRREALITTGNTPAFEFATEYLLPTDYLKILELWSGDVRASTEYQIENGLIVTNDDDLSAKYIADVDEDLFDPNFAEYLSLKLASKAAYSLTQDKALKDQLTRDAEEASRRARSMDAQEGTPQDVEANTFLNARL